MGDGRLVMKRGLNVLVSTLASDAHTWNLVFLQMLLEELGHRVTNLGPCTPDELLVDECSRLRPDLVVISTVNGHGVTEGMRVIHKLRNIPAIVDTPIVIGGKLGTSGQDNDRYVPDLVYAGFDAVFEDGAQVASFRDYVASIPPRTTVMGVVTQGHGFGNENQ